MGLGKARTLTLFFHSTPYFYEGYFHRVPLACARLGKARTLTLLFHSTPYFYEGYFCRVPLACALAEGVGVCTWAKLAL